jgi:hypothetical protein
MKKFKVHVMLVMLVGFLMSFLCYLPNANAYQYSEWQVISNSIDYLSLSSSGDYQIWLSDNNDPNSTSGDIQVTGFSAGYPEGTSVDSDYPNSSIILTNADGDTLVLGDDTYYLYITDSSGTAISYTVSEINGHQYWFASADGDYFAQIDVDAVPIPPSALLMGSGLIGLIGFGVRRRRAGIS